MPFAIIAVIVIAAIGAGLFIFNNTAPATPVTTDTATETAIRPTNETDTAESNTATETSESDPDTDSATAYTDGTYSASASYLTPRRTEQTIEVSLTVENDIVVDANVMYDDLAEGYSNDNQARFDRAYAEQVIGQPLDTISLSRVGSASLTSGAFNEAKAKIATAARS